MRKTAPPQLNIIQNDLQNNAVLEFISDTPNAVFYYTLNNNVAHGAWKMAQAGENTFIGFLKSHSRKTTTVQVLGLG